MSRMNWEPYALITLFGMQVLAIMFQNQAKWLWDGTCLVSKAIFCLLVSGTVLHAVGTGGMDNIIVFGPQPWLAVVSDIVFGMAGVLVFMTAIVRVGRCLPDLPRRHNRRSRQRRHIRSGGGHGGFAAFKQRI